MATLEKVKQKEFRLWKPTFWDYFCKFILSESFAVCGIGGLIGLILNAYLW
jgi:hypothetical protein